MSLADSGAPEDEGNHIQKVYKQEHRLGGAMKYAYHDEGHLTEDSTLLTDANRERIFGAWTPFWNMTQRVLVEKSPRHIIMTRFLQAAFTPAQSRFLLIMRHPLAAGHYEWFRNRKYDEANATCGRPWVEHWLQLHRHFLEDVPHLDKAAVFQYERLLAGALELADARMLTQGWLHALFKFMGLSTDAVRVRYRAEAKPGEKQLNNLYAHLSPNMDTPPSGGAGKARRRLLEFYGGDRYEVKINDRLVYNWVQHWEELIDMTQPVCQQLIADHEAELNGFGYSLKDLTLAVPPPVFKQYHLKL